MDQGWCDIVIGFPIREGSSDGVTLDGREVVFTADFPGPTFFDGNATARMFIDAGADHDQQRELEAIFQGQKGGPMGNLAPLVTTWLPTKTANIRIQEEGDTISVAVEGTGHMRSNRLRDSEGNTFTLRGGGFISGFGLNETTLELAPTGADWADEEMPRRFETKSGARGNFTWSG